MVDNSSPPHTSAALLDIEPDVLRRATCPMCHTPTFVTHNAIEAGGDWRCVRCGQHWNAARLAAVAAYAAWRVDHDRVGTLDTETNHNAVPSRDLPTGRLGGTP
jgi:predicted Zn finger-like uncharacterized protein